MPKNQSKIQFWVSDFERAILERVVDATGTSKSEHIRNYAIRPFTNIYGKEEDKDAEQED